MRLYEPFQPTSVVVIGCGGIGIQVVPNLARFMAYSQGLLSGLPLRLVDGDTYGPENRERQFFTRIGNKAEVTADYLEGLFPLLVVEAYPYKVESEDRITEDNESNSIEVRDVIEENSIVLVCVDNHPARRLISKHAQTLNNVVVINGGNEYTDGSVHIYLKMDGEELFPPIEVSDPLVEESDHEAPFAVDCIEEAAAGNTQLLFTNNLAAALMLGSLYVYSEGRLRTSTVQFDLFAEQGGLIGPAAMLST